MVCANPSIAAERMASFESGKIILVNCAHFDAPRESADSKYVMGIFKKEFLIAIIFF